MTFENQFMTGGPCVVGGHLDMINVESRGGGTFYQPQNDLMLRDLQAFPLFSNTIKELLGLHDQTEDVPMQIASFVHYAGKDLLHTLVNALMEDNVLQAVNINTGCTDTLATAVNSSGHFLRVNPHFTSIPTLRLHTYFISMVMTTIIMHPTGECSNLLRLVTGHSRNDDIQTYFKDLSIYFLFGSGFWPAPSLKLVAEASASVSVQVFCAVPFVSQVIGRLETFFFLPRLFQIVNEHDKHVLTRLIRLHPHGCPLGTFICQHDKNSTTTTRNNGFFTLEVFFSVEKKDTYNSVLLQEATAGTVTILNNIESMAKPCIGESSPSFYRQKVTCLSTPEFLLPTRQCQEVRRVTSYLRMSTLLAPHRITCNNATAPGEVEARSRLGQRVSMLQTLQGGHERMVLSLAVALHLANPLAIQVIVALNIDTYLDTIHKYNHAKHITIMRSIDDLHLFYGHRRVFLLSASMITLELADLIHNVLSLVVRTLIVDVLEPSTRHILLIKRIFKHEQLVVAQPKQSFQRKKKSSAKIEVFVLESITHNVQDIIAEHKHKHILRADLLHDTLSSIDIKGDRNISVDLRSNLKHVLQFQESNLLYPVVLFTPLASKRSRSDDDLHCNAQQQSCKRRKEANLKAVEMVPSAKFIAFKEKVLPSILSQQSSHFNVLVVVSEVSVTVYQKECQRHGLTTALFDYKNGNITRDRKSLVRSLKNNSLQVLFVPSMASWSHTFKMENVLIIDATSARDNIGKTPSELGRHRCIVLSEQLSYTQWRLQENKGFKVDETSVQSCLRYLSGGGSKNFSLK